MKKLVWLAVCMSVVCALVCVIGCSSGGGEDVEGEKLASLMFSQMEVACERRDGWFGARHAEFKVSGSVKNNTENPINKDNLPALEAEDSSESYEPKITQDKLLAGETCDVTYEGDLDVGDGNVPTLSFVGGFDFDGLQDAEVELNAKLKGVVDDYGQEDAEKEEAEAKRKQEEEAAKAKKEQDRKDIEACKGKTAAEAYAVVEGTDYPFRFVDSFDVEVTGDVKAAARAAAQKASADEAEEKDAVANGDGKTVSGEKEAGEEPSPSNAKSEAAAKGRESESSAKGEVATKDEESDSTADAKATSESADAKIDTKDAESPKADADVTAKNEDAKADEKAAGADAKDAKTEAKDADKNGGKAVSEEVSKVGEAAVTEVEVSEDGLFSEAGVTFHLDYVDPAGAEERRAKLPTVTFSNMEYNVHLVPTTADKPYSLAVTLTGTVKVAASKDGDAKVAFVESLPTLSVRADKETSSAEATCDGESSWLDAGEEYAFTYEYVAPHKEKNPTYKFSLKKGDDINVEGIDKKVLADMEKHYNARMGNLPAEIAEYEENERQRQEQERIEREQREAEAQAERELKAAEEQAERERRAAEQEAERRARGCYVTETGNCYHTDPNCPAIRNSYDLIGMTVGEAQDMGYSHCGRCKY